MNNFLNMKKITLILILLLLSLKSFSQCNYTIDPDYDDTLWSPVQLKAKVLLSGPLASSGLMNDDLRKKGILPSFSPYDNTTLVNPGVFSNGGNDAIVDWVLISLKSNKNIYKISGLLQRDGDIVDMDGNSNLQMFIPCDSYYVKVSHRNHLGIQTLGKIKLTDTLTTIDFTNTYTPLYTKGLTNPTRIIGGKRALYAGNCKSTTPNEFITYSGAENSDRISLFNLTNMNNVIFGYLKEDCNMDGKAIYQGNLNDRNVILVNCNNSNTTIILEQTSY